MSLLVRSFGFLMGVLLRWPSCLVSLVCSSGVTVLSAFLRFVRVTVVESSSTKFCMLMFD